MTESENNNTININQDLVETKENAFISDLNKLVIKDNLINDDILHMYEKYAGEYEQVGTPFD